MKPITRSEGELGASETKYVPLAAPAQQVSIFVDNSTNVTASVTNSTTVDATALWSVLTLTSNAASIAGPITGVRLVANASGGDYSILATHER